MRVGEWMYRSTFSWPLHYLELHALAVLPRGKSPRYPLDKRLGWLQSQSGRREENSWHYKASNTDPSVVQPVPSRYIDYAIPAHDSLVIGKDIPTRHVLLKYRPLYLMELALKPHATVSILFQFNLINITKKYFLKKNVLRIYFAVLFSSFRQMLGI
jgi:hypothetical protein